MTKKELTIKIKEFLTTIVISCMGALAIVFFVQYVDTFSEGLIYKHTRIITCVSVGIVSVLTVITLCFLRTKHLIVYKIFLLLMVSLFAIVVALYILKKFGILEQINSVEKLREFVSGFGANAVLLFIAIQFLQVVILPIPSLITVSAGVLMFGVHKGALLSITGIVLGSVVAFLIGKTFGYKVVKWLIGEKQIEKCLALAKGKDKVVLTFALLLPFFPDDVLCFVAGVTKMNTLFFIITVTITRLIAVYVASLSVGNSLIPYDTLWGIIVWIILFILAVLASVLVVKFGNRLQNFLENKINSRTKRK